MPAFQREIAPGKNATVGRQWFHCLPDRHHFFSRALGYIWSKLLVGFQRSGALGLPLVVLGSELGHVHGLFQQVLILVALEGQAIRGVLTLKGVEAGGHVAGEGDGVGYDDGVVRWASASAKAV